MQDGFATAKEAAAFFRLSRSKVYQLMARGELAFAKFGSARRIPWPAIRKLAERAMSRPAQEQRIN
jgi:excisionase family DNA binding protein